eukprot:CAMPEP_0182807444 /NCGR_PEP_ID=MMETSP0006_2-20121128/6135_1 /TAXON_ID=97485 /ORGANISM="Prymnesium parvum, Strain Texoma1" /LENGTH=157 /DNA_ID=CAMNT_0024933125 /DNA_START=82 /DNA_END=555 /DNA_ORIENTATION=+
MAAAWSVANPQLGLARSATPSMFVQRLQAVESAGVVERSCVPLMQTIAPEAPTITKEPLTLPESWVVPDTFSLKKTLPEKEPMFRVTLFKSSGVDVSFVTKAIMQVVGYDEVKSEAIASKAQTTGLALVGVWVQEVAEMYADGLRSKSLVVDISPGN